MLMTNAISNSMFRIMKETKDNFHGKQQGPTAPCPRCGANIVMQPSPDGRMGMFFCGRCRFRQVVRLQ